MATKKISMTVPVDLHMRMMKWKHAFNYSKIFQKAVSEQLDRKEFFEEGIKKRMNIDDIVMRLREEKKRLATDFYQVGQEYGTGFAMNASYENLLHCLNLSPDIDFAADPVLQEYNRDFKNDHIQVWDENVQDRWQRGFLDGVKDFWELIKDQL